MYGSSKELPHPVQWKWDGDELRTTYHDTQPATVFKITPVHFEERVLDRESTLYAFVLGVERNGDRMSRTYIVGDLEDAGSKIAVQETAGFVSPAGAPILIKKR